MSNLTPKHYQEFLESAIDPELIEEAFESVTGGEELFYALYPEPEKGYPRTNTGRLNGKYQKFLNNCEGSTGFIVQGVEPLTGEPTEYFRLKPDLCCPLSKSWDHDQQKLKATKYRSPLGVKARLIFFPTIPKIIERVQARYPEAFSPKILDSFRERHQLELIELTITPKNFWLFVSENPKIPIGLAEGEKKAASLLSIGIVAIALPGNRMGYRREQSGLVLHPDLDLFTQKGQRLFTFYFDTDLKPETQRNTERALEQNARLLLKKDCKVQVFSIPLLDDKKGAIDDYLYRYGEKGFDSLRPQSFIDWEYGIEQKYRITRTPNLIVNTPSMGKAIDASILPKIGCLLLDGAKATGKTELLENICKGDDLAVLSLGHRIFLMKGLAERLDLDYRNDVEVFRYKGTKNYVGANGENPDRLAACSEGLINFYSAISSQFINSENRKLLILDEVDQVLISVLTSSTCDQDGHRPVLLSIYEEIIRAADLIVLSSADVSDAEINYVLKIRNKGKKANAVNNFPVFYIKNEYVPKGYTTIFVESKEEAIELAKQALKRGENIWFICDSRALSEEVDKAFILLIGEGEKGLLINGDTSGEYEQVEFIKAIAKQDNPEQVLEFLKHYRFVVVTQSLWTSASITVDHFTRVYGCFSSGLNGDWDLAQSLGRIRKPVPRFVYCVDKGKPNPNFSGFYKNHIQQNLRLRTDINNRILASQLSWLDHFSDYQWGWDDSPHIDLYCHYVARENRSKFHLRERLESRLEYEGNKVMKGSFIDPLYLAAAKIDAKDARIKEKERQAEELLFNTHVLSDDDAKKLGYKPKLTKEQERQLKLYHFIKFYALGTHYDEFQKNHDNDTIKNEIRLTHAKDNDGRLREPIKRLEYLRGEGEGFDRAIISDVRSLNRQAKHGKGIFAPDLKNNTSKIWALNHFDFRQYLDPDQTWDKESLHPLLEAVQKINRNELSAMLGMKIPEKLGEGNLGANWLFSQIMTTLAIKTTSKRVGVGNDKESFISLDQPHWAWLNQVLTRRLDGLATQSLADVVIFSPVGTAVDNPPINIEVTGGLSEKEQDNPQEKSVPAPDVQNLFPNLKDKIVVNAETGRPDKVIKYGNYSTWITQNQDSVSLNDIREGIWRLPTVDDMVRWIKKAIAASSTIKAKWLSDNFGWGSDCLMVKAINLFPDELLPIYEIEF